MQRWWRSLHRCLRGSGFKWHPDSADVCRHGRAPRRFPPPWRADKMPGANGQALAYVYSHDHEAEALQVKVLTKERCAADRRQHRDAAGAAGEAGY